jgi:hypothetical protein
MYSVSVKDGFELRAPVRGGPRTGLGLGYLASSGGLRVPVRGELLLDLPVRGESLLDLELGYSMSSGSAVTGPLRVGPLRFGPGVGANRLLGLRSARGSAG